MFRPYTPDINWQNKAANEQFLADAERWVERYDLDGFRVDAVKHVQDSAVFTCRPDRQPTCTEAAALGRGAYSTREERPSAKWRS
jgi:glycosidase